MNHIINSEDVEIRIDDAVVAEASVDSLDIFASNQTYSVDKFLNQVHQRYAFNLITKVSEEQSLQFVESENQEDGSIRLLLRKVN